MLVWTNVATDTRVLREATALVGAGHTVHVVGRAVPSDFSPPGGVSVSSAGKPPMAQRHARALGPPERLARWALMPVHVQRRMTAWQRGALADAATRRADVVHAHDLSALPVGAELARRWQVPLVYDSHELWSGRPREGAPAPWITRTDIRLERELGGRAAVVLTVGDGVATALRDRFGWADVRVVRNTFPLRARQTGARQPTGLVYAGRLAAFRELEVIARASDTLDLPVTVIGPGDERWLSRFERHRVVVAEAEPLDAIDRRLVEAGLALVTHSDRWPNHRLALPNKLFHAVSLGVPVVATRVGELAEIVTAYELGTLYRPGDAGSLADAVTTATRRYPQLVSAVDWARPALSWGHDRDTLLGAYRELLGQR